MEDGGKDEREERKWIMWHRRGTDLVIWSGEVGEREGERVGEREGRRESYRERR